jgi:hypothetical protein
MCAVLGYLQGEVSSLWISCYKGMIAVLEYHASKGCAVLDYLPLKGCVQS